MYIRYTAEHFLWPITYCRVYSLGLKTLYPAHTRVTHVPHAGKGKRLLDPTLLICQPIVMKFY